MKRSKQFGRGKYGFKKNMPSVQNIFWRFALGKIIKKQMTGVIGNITKKITPWWGDHQENVKIILFIEKENKENGQFFEWSPEPILWQHHRHAMKQGPLKCGGMICNTQQSVFLLENIVSRLGNSRVGKISFISPPWPMVIFSSLIYFLDFAIFLFENKNITENEIAIC